jgi:carbon-monoxide dehydrogenase small subunit
LRLEVDGVAYAVADASAAQSLLRVLRDVLGITSAKNACEQGECGSCTVAIDGEIACACLVLAAQVDGATIQTASGLAPGDTLHPVQEAFVRAGAVQCGFCTPGFVIAARDLLERIADPTDDDIREGLAGNLCRCTGYHKIIDAVHLAAREMPR